MTGAGLHPLLPPPLRHWPCVLWPGAGEPSSDEAVAATMAQIRDGALFWPAPRAGARRCRVLAIGDAALAKAREAWADADILVQQSADLAAIEPEGLEAVFATGAVARWALLGGLASPLAPGESAAALLGHALGVSPWTGEALSLSDALEAQALMRRAAMRGRGRARLIAMSRWKCRGLAPFLQGPDGPPGPDGAGVPVIWGTGEAPDEALRVEDGFLRSVGLGLRHVHPLSLVIAPGRPHFDGRGPNSFDACVAEADFTPALLARAAALRARIVALRLSKYNLPSAETLPDTGGRQAVLVPGQVVTDASIRFGAGAIRDDAALLKAVRARFPTAFLLYKPHPDTLSGLRRGRLAPRAALEMADAVVERADIATCLDWADRVATITSLTGFEALLRGKNVTVFGRPFYAGWGLTEDADPPPRARTLSLDALTAAALLLHASYVDPVTGLPAPAEIVIERLAAQRAEMGGLAPRARALWGLAVSWLLNWRPPGLR